MENVWIQFILMGGSAITGLFFTIRYLSQQKSKSEKQLFEHTQKSQEMMLEYFETKNGHMERMANKFTDTADNLANVISGLSTKIEVMSATKNKKK